MKEMIITRFLEIPNSGTFGTAHFDGEFYCFTKERNWKNNEPCVSCIPEGGYFCNVVEWSEYGRTFEVEDVPGRSMIRFHNGSYSHDSKGCILIGTNIVYDTNYSEYILTGSKSRFNDFKEFLKNETRFRLTIMDYMGVYGYGV